MKCPNGRDIAPVVDAGQEWHGRFDPTRKACDDAGSLEPTVCGVQPELL
jgi:hypothetical protein